MKTLRYSVGALAGIALLGMLACTTSDKGQSDGGDSRQQQPVAATSSGSGSASNGSICPADPAWFAGPTTAFPDDAKFPNSSNCDFHQWAWQTFLALMSPADTNYLDGPRVFEQLADQADLFPPDGDGPKQGYPGRP